MLLASLENQERSSFMNKHEHEAFKDLIEKIKQA